MNCSTAENSPVSCRTSARMEGNPKRPDKFPVFFVCNNLPDAAGEVPRSSVKVGEVSSSIG